MTKRQIKALAQASIDRACELRSLAETFKQNNCPKDAARCSETADLLSSAFDAIHATIVYRLN